LVIYYWQEVAPERKRAVEEIVVEETERERVEREQWAQEQEQTRIAQENAEKARLENTLVFLKEYNGKYPSEVKLFEKQILIQRLQKLLGNNRFNFIKNMELEVPIKIENNHCVVEGCKAHECGFTNFIIVYDFMNDLMSVGIHDDYKITTYSENGIPSPIIKEWADSIW
jgi:hypothetical protein